ncbi:MAG TPA: hypothetical protein VND93_21895 [Myxococcales bacterium]|nr:hypothetical protein [Myxococcales bacterium]
MANIPSSRAAVALALALLSGAAAAVEVQEPARSIAAPSIASAALPTTGTVAGPAVSADVSTDTGETAFSASLKLTGPSVGLPGLKPWALEASLMAAQSSGVAAVFDNVDGVSSGAQLSLALTYAEYDLLPREDPRVKPFRAALHACGAVSSTDLREVTRELDQIRDRKKRNELKPDSEEDKKAATRLEDAEKAGCTFTESDSYWLAESARAKPFLFSAKLVAARSDAVFLADGTFEPVSDLFRYGGSIAIGQYILSNAVIAVSFKVSVGNLVTGAPVEVCRQIAVDPSGNPVTQCDKGIAGTPVPGVIYKGAMEFRHLLPGGLAWVPSASITWANQGPPRLRAQLPILFSVVPTKDDSKPLMLGITFGVTSELAREPVNTFTVAGTVQSQLSLGKL